MKIVPLFDPAKKKRPMRIAAFMSGKGTNVIKLIEHQKKLEKERGSSPFEVVFIFSDRSDGTCRGEKIAYENVIPYFSYDIRMFYKSKGFQKPTIRTPQALFLRERFDEIPKKLLKAFEIDLVALGGYMSYTTIKRCINVHPADLRIKDKDGKRKYTGANAVRDAILAGEKYLRSCTILTDEGIDTGPILMISKPIPVKLPVSIEKLSEDPLLLKEVVEEHQERLKREGDWKIFPKTIEYIAQGRFAIDEKNRIYFDETLIPEGIEEK
jgi:folate-dependent phosphoribosylglycinamide formyltransferase PurN